MSRVVNEKNASVEEQAPDGEFVEEFANTSELYSMSEAARMLGLDEKTLTDLLVEDGVFYREGEGMPPQPHAEWVEKGYFVMVPEDATVPEEGVASGMPSIIEKTEAPDQLIAIKDQIIEVLHRILAVSKQIIALNNAINKARAAYAEIVNDSVKTDFILGLREDAKMRDFLLMVRNAMLTRSDVLFSEKRRLLSAAQSG